MPQPQHSVLASVRPTQTVVTVPIANSQFTELPGVVAQAQVPNAPVYAQNRQATQQAQNGQGVHGYGVYSTQSSHGTWLFPPNANQGGNS